MSEVISTTIEIIAPTLPPSVEFIENEFEKNGLDVIRWAIIKIENSRLTLSISYLKVD